MATNHKPKTSVLAVLLTTAIGAVVLYKIHNYIIDLQRELDEMNLKIEIQEDPINGNIKISE